jgi:hypothetical protein
LFTILQEASNSAEGVVPDSIVMQFVDEAFMGDELSVQLAPALTYIYQKSITAGEVTDDWEMAHVVPIFKKGDKSKSSNYRPVSLTSICSKLMEHILHSNIMSHFEKHAILTEARHGLTSGRSLIKAGNKSGPRTVP